MQKKYQKVKVTIELENGIAVEFIAALQTKERNKYDLHPPNITHGRKWKNRFIEEPPKWDFSGTTIGEITITLP